MARAGKDPLNRPANQQQFGTTFEIVHDLLMPNSDLRV
jgi:hypothetical protein